MYNPPHFEESRPDELERIIAEYPLGTLVYHAPDGLNATHLPFIYKKEQGSKLIAHVARKNVEFMVGWQTGVYCSPADGRRVSAGTTMPSGRFDAKSAKGRRRKEDILSHAGGH
jgi:Putative FMN-binding domain